MNAFIPSRRRTGFTLVEVLVVTGILAILFALATGVAIRAMITAQEARVTAEMRQLETAIVSFKTKYGVSYLPSRFRLRALAGTAAAGTGYFSAAFAADADPIEKQSREFLFSMFPRLDGTKALAWFPNTAPYNWNANSVIDMNGPECLLFFLGGWNGIEGFSKDPRDPSTAVNTALNAARTLAVRGDVSFEFDTKRIKPGVFCMRTRGGNGASQGTSGASPANVYLDPYSSGENADQPYYYFTSYKSGNDYSPLDAIIFGSGTVYPAQAPGIALNQGNGVSPFPFQLSAHVDSSNRTYFNPRGFQLISAGRDKQLSNIPVTTTATHPTLPQGFTAYNNGQFITTVNYSASTDNLCNFHPVKMGTPQ